MREYDEANLIMTTKAETGLERKYKLQLYFVTVSYILRECMNPKGTRNSILK